MTFSCATTTFAGAAATGPKDERSDHGEGLSNSARVHRVLAGDGVEDRLGGVAVPTLEVGGTWDQEDMWGTQAEYAG